MLTGLNILRLLLNIRDGLLGKVLLLGNIRDLLLGLVLLLGNEGHGLLLHGLLNHRLLDGGMGNSLSSLDGLVVNMSLNSVLGDIFDLGFISVLRYVFGDMLNLLIISISLLDSLIIGLINSLIFSDSLGDGYHFGNLLGDILGILSFIRNLVLGHDGFVIGVSLFDGDVFNIRRSLRLRLLLNDLLLRLLVDHLGLRLLVDHLGLRLLVDHLGLLDLRILHKLGLLLVDHLGLLNVRLMTRLNILRLLHIGYLGLELLLGNNETTLLGDHL